MTHDVLDGIFMVILIARALDTIAEFARRRE